MNWLAFANPWMLAGLAAVGLPILIHYLTRARPRRIAFPPFKFLLEACAGQQAVHRLRTILLLAIRCLAVFALVMLFARPFLKPTQPAAGNAAAKRAVVVLDGSLSMRAVQQGVSLFSRAKADAADLLRGLDAGAEAAIIIAGAKPRPLLPALSPNISALHDALVQAEPTFEAADMTAALSLAHRLLGGAGHIYVFSDFQQSNWKNVSQLPDGVICRLRPVTEQPVRNIGLTSLRIAPAEPVSGEPTEIVATLFNSTPEPRQETVRLELGEITQERRVSLPPFGAAEVAFTINFPQPGTFIGKAALNGDDLREDDTRHIALQIHKALQLLVMSDADASDQRSAAFFLTRALAPSETAVAGVSVIRRHSQDADRGVLETADGFVLVAPATPSGEAVEIIARRVNEGAHLLVVLDSASAPALVHAAFNAPFQLSRFVTSAGDTLVLGPQKLFADADATDWSPVKFRRYFQTQLLDGRATDVMLAYPDGSAALTLTKVGKGAVAFANLSLSAEGSDLVGSPMFPAMMHELLRAMRRGGIETAVTPGQTWTLDLATSGNEAPTVLAPNGQAIETQTIASGRTTRLAMPEARSPGPYVAKQGSSTLGAGVVNVDPAESDTRPIALQNLKPGNASSVTVLKANEEFSTSADSRPLWPLFAAAAAALLALEMLLLGIWKPRRVDLGAATPGSAAQTPVSIVEANRNAA